MASHRDIDEAKLAIFRTCFTGLAHAYGTYDPQTGRVWQVKVPVTDRVLLDHLRGIRPYGVYLLSGDHTLAAVADFDDADPGPPTRLLHRAVQFGLTMYLERSKRKGFHAWLFGEPPGVLAADARWILSRLLVDIGAGRTEVFPKQNQLSLGEYGNFIFTPLWGGAVSQGRTVFVDSEHNLQPYPDQWHLLASIVRVSQTDLHRLAATTCGGALSPTAARRLALPQQQQRGYRFGLAPCARRMLQGVKCNQRVTCFRLAIHFKRMGLPEDLTLVLLLAWSAKNRPADGQIIRPEEVVAQVRAVYREEYWSLGCEDPLIAGYCDPTCPVRGGRLRMNCGGGGQHDQSHLEELR